jgi:hypothetical protein
MSAPPFNSRPQLGDPAQTIEVMMAQLLGGSMGAASDGCAETEWRGHPAQKIFLAIMKGKTKELRRLLQDPELRSRVNDMDNDRTGILNSYAMNYKSSMDATGIISALVEAGGDVNLKSVSTQETPLQIAVMYGKPELVEVLLAHGARVDLVDWGGSGPIQTSKQKCSHGGAGDHACCKVMRLIRDAENGMKNDTELQKRAVNSRLVGNRAFAKQKYEDAREAYTKSIEDLADHRSYANRSLCNLKIGRSILQQAPQGTYPSAVAQWGREAVADAHKALTIDPTFLKAHYRAVMGKMMSRDFPRAKLQVKEGLEDCPDNEELNDALRVLNEWGVPDHISNPFSEDAKRANELIQAGAEFRACGFCRAKTPIPLEHDSCPFCTMSYFLEIDDHAIVKYILEHC